MPLDNPIIFTIGYGGRGKDDFLELLKKHHIEVVADVRAFPNRARLGMFVKALSPEKGIEKLLSNANIDYVWLEELGNPDPIDPAMKVYREELILELEERTERLRDLAANPNSAEAARDVLVSLGRLAGAEGGRPGGGARALRLQGRSLELALRLREQNSGSYFYRRTAAVAFYEMSQRATAAGDEELAGRCLAGCYEALKGMREAGMEMDVAMRGLLAQLETMFLDGEE